MKPALLDLAGIAQQWAEVPIAMAAPFDVEVPQGTASGWHCSRSDDLTFDDGPGGRLAASKRAPLAAGVGDGSRYRPDGDRF